MIRLYVVGPVTGRENGNREAFEKAAADLHKAGFTAYIPHWFVPAGTEWQTAMKRSMEILVKCDGLAVLPDKESSRGTLAEIGFAIDIKMPVKNVEDWLCLGAMNEGKRN